MITDYTTFDDIRATLGVEALELTDETLGLKVFESGLEAEIYDVSSSLDTTYHEVLLIEEPLRTPVQKRLVSMAGSFATYAVAKQVAASMSMFAPRSIADGKSTLTRFSGEPYKDVLKNLQEQYDVARNRLVKALDELMASTSTVAYRTIFNAVGSGYDPVTGE